MTPSEIFARADDVLQDVTFVRWPQAERLRYLNDGRRAMAVVRPDIYAAVNVMTLVAGTKQDIPSGYFRFFDAIRNINSDNTPGNAVRVIEREVLDAFNPGWHSATAGVIKHFMFDERMPRVFHVYPPAAAGQKLEVSMAAEPADLLIGNINTDQLTQEGVHAGLLADYVIHRAYLKDAEYAGNAALSDKHLQLFMSGLGVSLQRSFATSPNTGNQGGVPSKIASGG